MEMIQIYIQKLMFKIGLWSLAEITKTDKK